MMDDIDRITPTVVSPEQLEHVVRAAVERAASKDPPGPQGAARRLVDNLKAYWPLFVGLVSIGLALIGWATYKVSPLESIREIAHQKEQRRFQQQLSQQHIDLGNDFLNVAQLEAAKAEFARARELDSYSVDAELGLLKVSVFEPVRTDEYDPEVAERRLQAILRQRPNDTHALAFLGDVYTNLDRDKALKYYRQSLASDQKNAYAYEGLGVLLDLQGKTPDALQMYEKAVSLSGWNQTFLNNLAYQYYLRANYSKAEELYLLLLGLDDRYFLSYCMLANTQLMLGSPRAAYRNLQRLDAMLRDGATSKLKRNNGDWFFHVTELETVHLTSADQKAGYVRLLMAVTAKLLALDDDVRRHLLEATSDSSKQSLRIVDSDINRLAKAQPALAGRLAEFGVAR
jgi:Flp pilus assembly protein TadD